MEVKLPLRPPFNDERLFAGGQGLHSGSENRMEFEVIPEACIVRAIRGALVVSFMKLARPESWHSHAIGGVGIHPW